MRSDLSAQKIVVDAKSADCAVMIQQISASSAEVQAKQAMAMAKNAELRVQSAAIDKVWAGGMCMCMCMCE